MSAVMPLLSKRHTPTCFATLSSCPAEILDHIISYLKGTDLKKCRLLSWQFHHLATPILFQRLTVDCYHFKLQDLAQFATAIHIASLVQEIVFDINDLTIRGVLQRLRRAHLRVTSKCHTSLLRKLKSRHETFAIIKPCHKLLLESQEEGHYKLLPGLIQAFRSFPALRGVRIIDSISDQRQIKPLNRGACLTCFGFGIPVLLLRDHRLGRLPSYEFHGAFSTVTLLALQLAGRTLKWFDGFSPVTRNQSALQEIVPYIDLDSLEHAKAEEVPIPSTLTEATLRLHVSSIPDWHGPVPGAAPPPIVAALEVFVSAAATVEALTLEVLGVRDRLPFHVSVGRVFDDLEALPRLRKLELTNIGLSQYIFEKFLISHENSLQELRLHSIRFYDQATSFASSWPRFIVFLRMHLSLKSVCLDGDIECDNHRWFAYPMSQLQGYHIGYQKQIRYLFNSQAVGTHRRFAIESIKSKERKISSNGQDLSGRIHRYILGAGNVSDIPLPDVESRQYTQQNGRQLIVSPIEWRGDWSWLSGTYTGYQHDHFDTLWV